MAVFVDLSEGDTPKKKTPDELFREKLSKVTDADLLAEIQINLTKMCKTGGRAFRMSVPPHTFDTDVMITELCRRYTELKNPAYPARDVPAHCKMVIVLPTGQEIVTFLSKEQYAYLPDDLESFCAGTMNTQLYTFAVLEVYPAGRLNQFPVIQLTRKLARKCVISYQVLE